MTDLDALLEFLLARIGEDEAVAHELLTSDRAAKYRHTGSAAETWSNSDHDEEGVSLSPDRWVAECEAKRRIVEWCSERNRVFVGRLGDDPTDPANYVQGEYAHQHDTPVLRLLALPYADHPDYREEWRA